MRAFAWAMQSSDLQPWILKDLLGQTSVSHRTIRLVSSLLLIILLYCGVQGLSGKVTAVHADILRVCRILVMNSVVFLLSGGLPEMRPVLSVLLLSL